MSTTFYTDASTLSSTVDEGAHGPCTRSPRGRGRALRGAARAGPAPVPLLQRWRAWIWPLRSLADRSPWWLILRSDPTAACQCACVRLCKPVNLALVVFSLGPILTTQPPEAVSGAAGARRGGETPKASNRSLRRSSKEILPPFRKYWGIASISP